MLPHRTPASMQALLFTIFAALTGVLGAVLGATYDNLLVPELDASSLYPALTATGGSSYLHLAAAMSAYVLTGLVDPAIGLVGLAVGLAYLGRSFLGRLGGAVEPLLGRLVLAVLIANFSLPIAGAILDLAGATYPFLAGFDGGAWRSWTALDPSGSVTFSWDNGVLAFVITFALFSVVLLLAAAVALRDALLGVLLVLLPLFTLLWPVPTLAPLARRAWLMFGELAFLPCVLVIPLELAVGSSSILLLLGYLVVALASPSLVSLAGAQLTQSGFPSAGGVIAGGIQRGLGVASSSVGTLTAPLGGFAKGSSGAGQVAGAAGRALGGSAFPAALPLVTADVLGRSAAGLVRHLHARQRRTAGGDRFGAVGGAAGGGAPHG
jgi:hypothetical protein